MLILESKDLTGPSHRKKQVWEKKIKDHVALGSSEPPDDIMTTSAAAAASVRVLASGGVLQARGQQEQLGRGSHHRGVGRDGDLPLHREPAPDGDIGSHQQHHLRPFGHGDLVMCVSGQKFL